MPLSKPQKALVDSFIKCFLKANETYNARQILIKGIMSGEAPLTEYREALEDSEEDLYSSLLEFFVSINEEIYEYEEEEDETVSPANLETEAALEIKL